MRTITLNGNWRVLEQPLARAGGKGLKEVKSVRGGWIPARVPGEIHLDLSRAGRMSEPLHSLNAPRCRWPEKKSWWYRTAFTVSAAFMKEERLLLVFDGIDLYGQVFLNGTLLGETRNALVPAVFDVGGSLKEGRNELVVRVTAGSELSPEPADERLGRPVKDIWANKQPWPGRKWLRKPQFTYGWDWVDALPNIGIWRGVRLEGRSWAVIDDLRLDTCILDGRVFLEAEAVVENLHPWSSRPCTFELTLSPPKGKSRRVTVRLDSQSGRQPVRFVIHVENPRLWWPNGMGDQPLYRVTARLLRGRTKCDRREFDYGLRTVEIDQTPLGEGSRFCVCVNGQDVFCKGGNWIPADAIIARVDAKKYDTLIDAAARANINMLRIWGGGIYENDEFYATCNRRGILVWHDFMFACSEYPDHDEAFRIEVRREAETAVRRLRHHPCIALWSGNNENTWGFANWWNKNKNGFEPGLKLGGRVIYNDILPEVCRLLDPNRPYWPGSPFGGNEPNDELTGDCHWWHRATMNPDVGRRIRHEVYDECRSRFNSEYGVIGPVNLSSLRKFLKPDELRVDGRAFRTHTNWYEKGTIPEAIRLHYADPEGLSLPDYILYGQMFQAMMYGRSIEAMRFRKNDPKDDCQGALIWMYTDCWGETGWTIIDYHLSRKPSYYSFGRSCAPVRAIVRRRGTRLVTRVVNDTLNPVRAILHRGWMHLDGSRNDVRAQKIEVPGNSVLEAPAERVPSKPVRDRLYTARLEGDGLDTDASTWFGAPFRELALAPPELRVRTAGRRIILTSSVYCHGVHADDGGRGILSDNYFDLLPGVPRTIERLDGKPAKALRFTVVMPVPLPSGNNVVSCQSR